MLNVKNSSRYYFNPNKQQTINKFILRFFTVFITNQKKKNYDFCLYMNNIKFEDDIEKVVSKD